MSQVSTVYLYSPYFSEERLKKNKIKTHQVFYLFFFFIIFFLNPPPKKSKPHPWSGKKESKRERFREKDKQYKEGEQCQNDIRREMNYCLQNVSNVIQMSP